MSFRISDLTPSFFQPNPDSQIWNSDVVFEPHANYQIYAPSGKGKSSFFRMLTGIENAYTGKITYNYTDLKNTSIGELSAFRFAEWSLVFQSLNLFEKLSVRQNLEIYSFDEKTEYLLSNLHLKDKMEHLCSELSYGERQRLAIIRALSKDYNFLIMDEPFSHLDNELKKTALELIFEDVKSKGAGLILLDLHQEPGFDNHFKL